MAAVSAFSRSSSAELCSSINASSDRCRPASTSRANSCTLPQARTGRHGRQAQHSAFTTVPASKNIYGQASSSSRSTAVATQALSSLSSLSIVQLPKVGGKKLRTGPMCGPEGCMGGNCEANRAKLESLIQQFTIADTNGDGKIDKEELRTFLSSTNSGEEHALGRWITQEELDAVLAKYDMDNSGDISFEEFTALCQDGLVLEGKLEEYAAAFQAIDTSGNGSLGGAELARLFEDLGQPLSYQKVFNIMERYDLDLNGQISFKEFLRMFRNELLDLQEILDYMKLNPQARPTRFGNQLIEPKFKEVTLIFSEEELDQLSVSNPDTLICLMASLTWCRPCKGFERPFEKFAAHYDKVLFLKFFGNFNDSTKRLLNERLGAPMTPAFAFFRAGELVHCHTGANKVRLEQGLQGCVVGEEDPLFGASPFKRQVWQAQVASSRF